MYISKFDMSSGIIAWIWNGVEWIFGIDVELKRVGTIARSADNFRITSNIYPWPKFITGGDISRDGELIVLRGHQSKFT